MQEKKTFNSDGEAEKTADEMQRRDPFFNLEGRHASMPTQIAIVDTVPRGYGTSDFIHVWSIFTFWLKIEYVAR